MRLQLSKEWILGDRIGRGGFGQVYAANSPGQMPAVAKLVPKDPGAERELLFVDLAGLRNVVPVIDSGETDDSWVIVMPRAKMSLRQHVNQLSGGLGTRGALIVLSNLATALVDLAVKGVVHRDLKPENVLLLGESWCLSDFGISRYAEATTAPDTRKYMCSPPYAAPEQWRGERATSAADVYSLGVLAYELLSGSLPFKGPHAHEFREQHLHARPARIGDVPVALEALIEESLYKAASARPSPSNLLARLERLDELTSAPVLARLQEANLAETIRRGEHRRRESEDLTEREHRSALAEAARTGLDRISNALREAMVQAAPSVVVQTGRGGGWTLRLNQSELQFVPAVTVTSKPWGSWTAPKFDVVAHAAIGVQIPRDRDGYEGRSHALWFCDAGEVGRYQWFETAFMISPLIPSRGRQNPFALDPGEESAKALSPGLTEFQVAWPFTPIALDEIDEFINRWAIWFADASQGKLAHPSAMPERSPEGTWRRT
jgi:eukaryotic-like serine/threonine-protein kinase